MNVDETAVLALRVDVEEPEGVVGHSHGNIAQGKKVVRRMLNRAVSRGARYEEGLTYWGSWWDYCERHVEGYEDVERSTRRGGD